MFRRCPRLNVAREYSGGISCELDRLPDRTGRLRGLTRCSCLDGDRATGHFWPGAHCVVRLGRLARQPRTAGKRSTLRRPTAERLRRLRGMSTPTATKWSCRPATASNAPTATAVATAVDTAAAATAVTGLPGRIPGMLPDGRRRNRSAGRLRLDERRRGSKAISSINAVRTTSISASKPCSCSATSRLNKNVDFTCAQRRRRRSFSRASSWISKTSTGASASWADTTSARCRSSNSATWAFSTGTTSASFTDPTNNLFSLFSRPAPETGLFGTSPAGVNLPNGPNPFTERAHYAKHRAFVRFANRGDQLPPVLARLYPARFRHVAGRLPLHEGERKLCSSASQGSEQFPQQPPQGSPLAALEYKEDCENNLAGFQMGGDIWISLCQGLRVGSEAKVGIYDNHSRLANRISTTPQASSRQRCSKSSRTITSRSLARAASTWWPIFCRACRFGPATKCCS